MPNSSQSKFRYEILILFVLFEVLFFNINNSVKLFITLIEYVFVGYFLIKNIETGLMYLISFTILTVGIGNYPDITNFPSNFWGIRLFGFSFNILFSFATFIFILSRNNFKLQNKFDQNIIFFFVFFLYSFIIGIFSIIFSINYSDNMFTDIMTYLPIFVYVYFLSIISLKATRDIIKHAISATIILMILSSIFNIKSLYSDDKFVLQNALTFILPIALFTLKDFYTKSHLAFYVFILVTLIILQEYFLGGKSIIMFVVLLIWVGYSYRKWRIKILILGVFAITFFIPISNLILDFYSGNVISFKFSQIFSIFLITDIDFLANTPSSMGSLIAEGKTIYYHLINNPFYLFFGKGFGGGIPDIFGYLQKWSIDNLNGYAPIDFVRNNYFKMHLPIYEVVLKSGIIGLIWFSYLLFTNFFSRNKYTFLYFCQLFFVFYVSKEFILVTLLFLKLAYEENVKNTQLY